MLQHSRRLSIIGKERAIQADRHAIEFGGQSRDGVPALDVPHVIEAQAAEHVLADDPDVSGWPAAKADHDSGE